jgi:phosphopantothenoylcysteine decarboxylase/phosphopantothenate--cysteine ligase
MDAETLLLVVTGTSGAILFPAQLVQLRQTVSGRISILMTASAERFVRAEVLGWFADEIITCDTPGVNPVELALRAKAVVVLPASANILACAALGLAPSPAATALLAAPAPCLFFPHMNPVMWDKDVVQQHVATLRGRGHVIVEPEVKQVYEMWRRTTQPGRAMPSGEQVACIVRDWLAGDLPCSSAAATDERSRTAGSR